MAQQRTDWAAISTGILAAAAVLWVMWALWGIVLPFVLGAIFAYTLDPLVSLIMRRARCSRTWATSLVFVFLSLSASLAVVLIWPPVIREMSDLVAAFPRYVDNLQHRMDLLKERIIQLNEGLGGSTDLLFALKNRVQDTALALGRYLAGQVMAFLNNLANLVLIPLITFFLLKDKEQFLKVLSNTLPAAHRPAWAKALSRIDRMLAAYFRGTAIVGLVTAVVSFIGFTLIGMPYAVLLSIVRGAGILVPYLGFAISIIPPLILAALSPDPWMMLLGVAILFAVTELLQGFVLVPTIIGSAIDLHELTVLLAILVGGTTLGLWGIILALPAAAIIKILITEWAAARRASGDIDASQA